VTTRFLLALSASVVCACSVSLETQGHGQGNVDRDAPSVTAEDGVAEIGQKRIVSPGNRWVLFSSGHLVRNQPSPFGRPVVGPGPYTVADSYSEGMFDSYGLAHLVYYLHRGSLPEKYSHLESEAEKAIEQAGRRVSHIVRIDKLEPELYVITYARSRNEYSRFRLGEVRGYEALSLSPDFEFSDTAIFFPLMIRRHDRHGNVDEPTIAEMLIRDILLINPRFFGDPPDDLENVLIPYDFFAEKYIFQHPGVRDRINDVMIVKIKRKGVVVRLRKPTTMRY